MTQRNGKKVKCKICGKEHYRDKWSLKRSTNYYCSRKCQDEARKTGGYISCVRCGKKAWKHKCHLDKNDTHFCTIGCYNLYQFEQSEVRAIKVCEICGKNFRSVKHKKYWNRTCSEECRSVLMNSKAIYLTCKYCGKKIRTQKCHKERKNFCSKDCQNAYKTAKNTFTSKCCVCGKKMVVQNSLKRKNADYHCTKICVYKHLKTTNSPAWKGGWYLNGSPSVIMINVGKSTKTYSGGNKKKSKPCVFKARYRVLIELKKGYCLPGKFPVLHLNGDILDDREKNLYICPNVYALGKYLQGVWTTPSRSNINDFSCKEIPYTYHRHENKFIQAIIDDSMHIDRTFIK